LYFSPNTQKNKIGGAKMNKISCLALVGIFILSIALAGCGYMKKKEFEATFSEYKTEHEQVHSQLDTKVTGVDQKVDQQVTTLKESITKAKEDAIAAAETADGDTLARAKEFAGDEDEKVRAQAKTLADEAEKNSKEFAQSEDETVRRNAQRLANAAQNTANSAAATAERAEGAVSRLRSDYEAYKPIQVAVVHFTTGSARLTTEAKGKLDVAVATINRHRNALIVIKGHADGRPVIKSPHRSNWDLSEKRAKAAAKYLQEKGVTNKIEVVARAHTEPAGTPYTSEGRKMSRRAEVIIYPGGEAITQAK
jgi:flagellar motor protein MotB